MADPMDNGNMSTSLQLQRLSSDSLGLRRDLTELEFKHKEILERIRELSGLVAEGLSHSDRLMARTQILEELASNTAKVAEGSARMIKQLVNLLSKPPKRRARA